MPIQQSLHPPEGRILLNLPSMSFKMALAPLLDKMNHVNSLFRVKCSRSVGFPLHFSPVSDVKIAESEDCCDLVGCERRCHISFYKFARQNDLAAFAAANEAASILNYQAAGRQGRLEEFPRDGTDLPRPRGSSNSTPRNPSGTAIVPSSMLFHRYNISTAG
jgi:hypothetical protein